MSPHNDDNMSVQGKHSQLGDRKASPEGTARNIPLG